jgi:glycosyltransferase involved in cell wall biosynthesis
MVISYIHTEPIDSLKANIVQVIEMCNAFQEQGVRINLIIPENINDKVCTQQHIKHFFGINESIKIIHYKKYNLFNRLNKLGCYYGLKGVINNCNSDYIFTRNPIALKVAMLHNKKRIIYESHDYIMDNISKYYDKYWRYTIRKYSHSDKMKLFITISKMLSDDWVNYGVNKNKVIVLHDAYNDNKFHSNISKDKARELLNIKSEAKVVLYSGSLYPDRDIEQILFLAERMKSVIFIVVGGPHYHCDYYKNKAMKSKIKNIIFVGPVLHREIPLYLSAADVLLALWSDRVKTIRYCSPLKIFEYMAVGKTIVANDYPSIKEILRHGENAYLVSYNDRESLLAVVRKAITDNNQDMINAAKRDVREYTWHNRVRKIINQLI